MKNIISIDIGGTNYRIGLFSSDNQLNYFEVRSSQTLQSGDVVDILASDLKAFINKHALENKVDYIAIGVPSVVDKDKSYIHSTPNISSLNEVNLGKELFDKLGIKVFVDRDVNFLLYQDIKSMDLDPQRDKTILGFYFGTGLGNAIYINGKSYLGSNGAAGELGHIPTLHGDKPCGCGRVGCIETISSGKALVEIVEENFAEVGIENIFKEKGDDPKIINFVEHLAVAVAIEANILDPEIIIIGGGVVFIEDFNKELLIAEIKKRLRKPFPHNNIKIIFSEHTQETGVLGGGKFIVDNVI